MLLGLLVGPLLYLAYLAWFQPSIAFLPPSWQGQWIRHPVHDVVSSREVAEAEFVRAFHLDSVAPFELRARAFGEMQITLNGELVGSTPDATRWKEDTALTLREPLRVGTNVLAVRVRNPRGNPVLLVDAPGFLRTPLGWVSSSLDPYRPDRVDAVSALYRPPRPGPLQRSAAWGWLKYATVAWIVTWLSAAAICLRRPLDVDLRRDGRLERIERLLPPLLIAVAAALQVANAARYPYARSTLDWEGHVAYVQHVAATWSAPLATDGWEMFHPPLYYFVAAVIYQIFGGGTRPETALKAVQFVGAAAGSLLPVVAWLQLKLLRPHDVRGAWLATALVAFLPMCLYVSPLVSNEAFAATLTATAVCLSLRILKSATPSSMAALMGGAAFGAALLSKYSAIPAFLCGLSCLAIRTFSDSSTAHRRILLSFATPALLLAGWFFLRNTVVFGYPLVANWDPASGFAFLQEPTFRTAGFFLTLGNAFFQHPTRSIWSSFLDGHYASIWADCHSTFFLQSDDRAFLVMSLLLLIAAAPSAVTALGYVATFFRALRSPVELPSLMMSAVVLATLWSLVLLALQAPHYSSIKAFYGLSLVPTFAVCFAVGRERLAARLPAARWLLDVSSVACVGIAAWQFRW